jgi:hypothetical protein
MSYDPTEYSSIDEAARSRAAMDAELGMPSKPYPRSDELGRRVNREHFERQARMNDELGWCGQTREGLAKKWGVD